MIVTANPSLIYPLSLPHALDWIRNGEVPSGNRARKLSELYNTILGWRKKSFSKSILPTQALNTGGDQATWRFAMHTSPVTSQLALEWVYAATGTFHATPTQPNFYVNTETGLTGSGTSTDHDPVYASGILASTADTEPDLWYSTRQLINVDPDTDYRITVHNVSFMRVLGLVVQEMPKLVMDTSTDTGSIDTSAFYATGAVTGTAYADVTGAAAKVWKRCGPQVFSWSVDAQTAITRNPGSFVNLLDSSVTTFSASSPGFPAEVDYHGSLDSSNVPCVVYCYAGTDSGTGKVRWIDDAGTLATIDVSGAAAWYSTTCNLRDVAAATPTTKVDVHVLGPGGGNNLSVYAAGMFLYGA